MDDYKRRSTFDPMKPIKITHFLGVIFTIYAAFIALSLWHHVSVTVALIRGGETPRWTPPFLGWVGNGGILFALFWLGMALLTGIGMFRTAGWARWLGLFLAGSVPISYLNRGLMYGATTVFTPKTACALFIALVIFLFLWKSQEAEKIFGHNQRWARETWVCLMIWCLIPMMLFSFIVYIKVKYGSAVFTKADRVVLSTKQEVEAGFIQRDLLNFRIAVPLNAQVAFAKRSANNKDASVTLRIPDKTAFLLIHSEALGELMSQIGQAIGITKPYDVHRQLLWSRWNVVFLLLHTLSVPSYGDDVRITEFDAPRWEGFAIQGKKKNSLLVEYSMYNRDEPHQSVSCSWIVTKDVLNASQIERSMNAFDFLPPEAREQYVQEAHESLAERRSLDAQFALTQAYLLGERDQAITKKLAEVSAKLGSWGFVERLTKELLADNPEDSRAKALYKRSLKASERKE